MHPERIIKLLCEDGTLVQPQGGALCRHYCAADVERDDILIRSKENSEIIALLFKQEPLLNDLVVGRKECLLFFF